MSSFTFIVCLDYEHNLSHFNFQNCGAISEICVLYCIDFVFIALTVSVNSVVLNN